MVRLSDDLAVFDRKGVVILAAAKARHAKARAKHRVAKARGRAENRAFDDTADAVALFARRRDGCAHLLAARIADDGELLACKRACQLSFVRNARNGSDAAHKRDALAR